MNNEIDLDKSVEYCRDCIHIEVCCRWPSLTCDCEHKLTAQPERKRGEWINDRGLYKCTSCNQFWAEGWASSKPIERMKKEVPYCPMCGSYNGGK